MALLLVPRQSAQARLLDERCPLDRHEPLSQAAKLVYGHPSEAMSQEAFMHFGFPLPYDPPQRLWLARLALESLIPKRGQQVEAEHRDEPNDRQPRLHPAEHEKHERQACIPARERTIEVEDRNNRPSNWWSIACH